MRRLLPILLLLLVSAGARAETRRIAVVAGNNTGSGELPPLRFAETDAGKLARALVEVGNVAPDDLFLLQGRPVVDVEGALALARDRIDEIHRRPDARVVLLFYFSGHSDGEALELGAQRLPFGRLKALLASTGAEVRVAIIDACRSGAAIAAKGGKPAPAFNIRLADELATSGEAILTSSAADEVALESREVMGSYFTHHFVSGLRGAADASGDGQVTLAEVYRYAYDRTLSATAATLGGAQHPVYDFKLSGQGELVLASQSRQTARLELPEGFDRALVTDLARDQVVAELSGAGSRRLALAPGNYGVRAFKGGKAFGGRFQIASGGTRSIDWAELTPLEPTAVARKGEPAQTQPAAPVPTAEPFRLSASLGVSGGVADSLSAVGALRLSLEMPVPSGLSVSLAAASGGGPRFWETSLGLRLGYALGLELGSLEIFAALEAGPGIVWQQIAAGGGGSTMILFVGPRAGARLALTPSLRLILEGEAMVGMLTLDQKLSAIALPAAFFGIQVSL